MNETETKLIFVVAVVLVLAFGFGFVKFPFSIASAPDYSGVNFESGIFQVNGVQLNGQLYLTNADGSNPQPASISQLGAGYWVYKDSTIYVYNHITNPPYTDSLSFVEKNPLLSYNANNCSISGTEMLISTTLSGGKMVSMATLNAIAPVNRFCVRDPAVFSDSNLNQSGTDAQIYYSFVTLSSFVVPASRTYTVYWVTTQTPQLFYSCSANFAYDPTLKNCVPVNGQAYSCASGQFVNGLCVVQPSVFCPSGTAYNGTFCVGSVVCPVGTSYNGQACSGSALCPVGTSYTGSSCVGSAICPSGTAYDSAVCAGQATCPVGTSYNGVSCVGSATCPAGMYWNGNGCAGSAICPSGTVWSGSACIGSASCPASTTQIANATGFFCLASPSVAPVNTTSPLSNPAAILVGVGLFVAFFVWSDKKNG